MFLMSLANILPRLASTTAFLCLVVAHLEWPLMVPLFVRAAQYASRQVNKGFMHTQIPGDLRVERGRHHPALAHRDDPTVSRSALDSPEHLDLRTHLFGPGRADEHGTERAPLDTGQVDVGLE